MSRMSTQAWPERTVTSLIGETLTSKDIPDKLLEDSACLMVSKPSVTWGIVPREAPDSGTTCGSTAAFQKTNT